MDDLVYSWFTDWMIYYYTNINLRLSTIYSGDIYVFLSISLLYSFVIVSELFCCNFFIIVQHFYYHSNHQLLLLDFDIPLLYCVALNLSIIYYLSSGNVYLSLGVSLLSSLVSVLDFFFFFFVNFFKLF